ncbi:hypothetical protein Q5752_001461 [Cryptotrichosporon argae]
MFALHPPRAGQPKTFALQRTLPRLPVPPLEDSVGAYLKSLRPVLEQMYDAGALPHEIEKRELYAHDFVRPGGLGRVLQERLRDLDHVSPHNWLDDTLWLALAYHTWRAPLLVNSNWWLLFKPDPANPPAPVAVRSAPALGAGLAAAVDGIKGGVGLASDADHAQAQAHAAAEAMPYPDPNPTASTPPGSMGGGAAWLADNADSAKLAPVTPADYEAVTTRAEITPWQVRRAAWITRRLAEFRTRILREEIAPDTSRAGPFDMSQYQKIFNLSRIPRPKSDTFSRIDNAATHVSVLIDDMVYSVDVFAPPVDGDAPEPLSVPDVEGALSAAVADAKARKEAGEKAPLIGVLTADERDTWTRNREALLNLSPVNRATLESISSSLVCLSLDPYTIPSLPSADPLVLAPVDAQIRNAASGLWGGRNRWFDKAISVVVETNGRAGVMGEHSPVDALIPSIVVDYVLGEPVDAAAFDQAPAADAKWRKLEWVTDDSVEHEITACQARNAALIADSDPSQLWFSEYGADWIKKSAKLPPDAYIQQALQLAWYVDQGYATATYESASTRLMLHGRTDVIRSLSGESRAFVKGMLDPAASDASRHVLLSTAVGAHNALTRAASTGKGYDRHLMGLKVHLRAGEAHALFDDDAYAKSQEWKLSTSGLSAGGSFMGTGFGAAWPDGYGINYLAGPHLVKFGIESKTSCAATSTARFKHNLVQALRDMRRVCEAAAAQTLGQGAAAGGGDNVQARL